MTEKQNNIPEINSPRKSADPNTPTRIKKYPLWKNVLAMIIVVALFIIGAYWASIIYTRHGEEITTPNLCNLTTEQALDRLEALGLIGEVRDSVYNRSLAPGLVCAQSVEAGDKVKQGRIIYLTINSDKADCLTLPDIADNSSYREATAKLVALGFTLTAPEYIEGEKDWVYAVKCKGYNIAAGTKVELNEPVTLVVGSGRVIDEEELMQSGGDTLNMSDDILELF